MAITGTVGQDLSIMVIDDDDFSCALLSDMLGEQGVTQIHIAGDGRAALSMLSKLKRAPDVLICDLFMPEMDGIEFLAALAKKKYAGCVVLVSGMNIEVLRVAQTLALTEGIHLLGSFEKPIRRDTLASILDESSRLVYANAMTDSQGSQRLAEPM